MRTLCGLSPPARPLAIPGRGGDESAPRIPDTNAVRLPPGIAGDCAGRRLVKHAERTDVPDRTRGEAAGGVRQRAMPTPPRQSRRARGAGESRMAQWVRFERDGRVDFGTLNDGTVAVHSGDMFAGAAPTGERVRLADVRVRTPSDPSKMICVWNNFQELAAKLNVPPPDEPLYLLKAPNAFLAHGENIRRPKAYAGRIVYEGELGIVIGRRCSMADEPEASACIFGYTCVNDVTAADVINKNPTFAQWVRAKSFDTFGAFGPSIATGIDPMRLRVRTLLNGEVRQDYPVDDMFFPPVRLVSLLSRDMTLMPGDVIACGTSVGVGSMKESPSTVEVAIEGVGTLRNVFEG
jgi:2-keto-4-pentenoate hydratase/2-oxohepta-3-ene-1,7-dioic acid hydratase in catechol pathway